MNEVKINIPEGHEIDMSKSDLSNGNIFFKKKEFKLPTTNLECKEFIKKDGYYINYGGISTLNTFHNDSNVFITSREYAEAFLALMQLIKFRDIWNEGWIADWINDEYKYIIYFYKGKKVDGGPGVSLGGAKVLSFKTSELRDKFSETFDDLIQLAKPLL